MNETEWFSGARIDEAHCTHSMLLDAIMAALLGWALFMCAIATALRAWRGR